MRTQSQSPVDAPKSKVRDRRILIALIALATVVMPSAVFAARTYLFVYNGQPIVTTQGGPDTQYKNCYYGDDGEGNPTGVASFEDTSTQCADGSDGCVGTMQTCDCRENFGEQSSCPE